MEPPRPQNTVRRRAANRGCAFLGRSKRCASYSSRARRNAGAGRGIRASRHRLGRECVDGLGYRRSLGKDRAEQLALGDVGDLWMDEGCRHGEDHLGVNRTLIEGVAVDSVAFCVSSCPDIDKGRRLWRGVSSSLGHEFERASFERRGQPRAWQLPGA